MTEKYQNKYRVASARAEWWNYAWSGAYFITICTKNRRHFFGEIKNGKIHLSPAGIIANVLWYQIPFHAKNVELGAFVVMPNHLHGILILNDPPDSDLSTVERTVETGHALSLHVPNSIDESKYPINPIDAADPKNHDNSINPIGRINSIEPIQPIIPIGPINPIIPDRPTISDGPIETGRALSLQMDEPNKIPPLTEILIQEIMNSQKSPLVQARYQNQGKNTVSSIVGSYKSAVTKNANRLNVEFDWQTRFYDNIIRTDADYQRINDYIETNPQNWNDDKFFTP
jgi:REP element-mobilizing transposase RayT